MNLAGEVPWQALGPADAEREVLGARLNAIGELPAGESRDGRADLPDEGAFDVEAPRFELVEGFPLAELGGGELAEHLIDVRPPESRREAIGEQPPRAP